MKYATVTVRKIYQWVFWIQFWERIPLLSKSNLSLGLKFFWGVLSLELESIVLLANVSLWEVKWILNIYNSFEAAIIALNIFRSV